MSEEEKSNCIEIDGSIMEGGGQILRNCTALSGLLKKPIHIYNIRGKRPKPGLRPQHLFGINLVQQICGGTLRGNTKTSMDIAYTPGARKTETSDFRVDTETAGSVCLLLQTSLPCFLFCPGRRSATFIGGTNAAFAPQIDYATNVLRPLLQRLMGIEVDISLQRRGFYPRGGGVVRVETQPVETIPAFNLTERGNIVRVNGVSIVAGRLPYHIAERQVRTATRVLRQQFGPDLEIDIAIRQDSGQSNGNAIVLWAETDTGCIFGGSGLGDRKKKAEAVGEAAATEIVEDWTECSASCCDRHMQDQLIVFMALASGKSTMKIGRPTLHTETAIHFAQLMSGVEFSVTMDGDTTLIECEGIGLRNE